MQYKYVDIENMGDSGACPHPHIPVMSGDKTVIIHRSIVPLDLDLVKYPPVIPKITYSRYDGSVNFDFWDQWCTTTTNGVYADNSEINIVYVALNLNEILMVQWNESMIM